MTVSDWQAFKFAIPVTEAAQPRLTVTVAAARACGSPLKDGEDSESEGTRIRWDLLRVRVRLGVQAATVTSRRTKLGATQRH